MSIDYRTLLKSIVIESEADDLLATRIPDLCPDCKGSGNTTAHKLADEHGRTNYFVPCHHPNAPTIADLLRWGENVAKAEPFDRCRVATSGGKWTYAHALLAALRTEADR